MNKLFTKIAALFLGMTMAVGVGVAVGTSSKASEVRADDTTYVFTSKSWTATVGGTAANWTSGQDGAGFTNNGIQVTDAATGANGTSPISFSNISKIVLTYNTNKSKGAGTAVVKIGDNTQTSKDWAYSSGDGRTANYTLQYDYATPQTGNVKITLNTTTNSIYLVSCAITYGASTKTLSSVALEGDMTQKAYTVGDDWNYSGLKIEGYYDDNSHDTLSSDLAASVEAGDLVFDVDNAKASATTITSLTFSNIAWGEDTVEGANRTITGITVSAAKTVSSISLSGTYPTTFEQGDAFSHDGMVVTAHYTDETSGDVTSLATWSGYDMSQIGQQTVTVSYGGQSETYTITVNEAVVRQFELISDASGLVAGSKYVIGAYFKDDDLSFDSDVFISKTQNTNNRSSIALETTEEGTVVTETSDLEVFVLGGDSTNGWTFTPTKTTGEVNNPVIYAAGGTDKNYLRTDSLQTVGDKGRFDVTFNSQEYSDASVVAKDSQTSRNTLWYNYNTDSPQMFSCYGSNTPDKGSGEIYFYKLIDTSEQIALNTNSVSDMKGNTNKDAEITASNFTPTGISATYSVANIASVTAGTISDGVIPLNVYCAGVGSTVATITVNGGNETHTIDLSITVTQKPASLTLVNSNIKDGEIEVKLGGSRQISFTALDTDEESYAIDYSGITASSSNTNVRLTGSTNMVLNGDYKGDAVVTCTITATAGWETPITQTLTVHVIEDYNEKNVSISVINDVDVEQGDYLVIASHISSATATTHFGTNNHAIEDTELLFSYTNNRSAGVIYSSFVWDVTGDVDETRTIYVFVTFNESYAGTTFTANVKIADRPVVGLKVDGTSKSNGDNINLELPRNSTYNFNEHVTVDPVNATESHEVLYTVTTGATLVSVTSGVMSISSKTGNAVVTVKPAAKQDFAITFTITITREAMKITADLPESWSQASSLSVGDRIAIVYESGETLKQLSEVKSTTGQVENYTTAGEPSTDYIFTVGQGNTANSYTFYNGSYYLAYTSSATSGSNNLYSITNPTSNDQLNQVSWTVSFDNVDAVAITNVYNTKRKLQYNVQSPRFCGYTGTQTDGKIYKLTGGTAEVTVTDALFNVVNNAMKLKADSTTLYDLALCNAAGTSFDTSAWNTLGSLFTDAIKNDNKLAYARANQNGNEIEQFLAVYDYVIGLKESGHSMYSGANDYLGRVDSGKITTRVNPISVFGTTENSQMVAIVVIVSVVSLTAIGGYFFLKKRREQN